MNVDSLTGGLSKSTFLSLICIGLKLQNLYFMQKQAKILVHYAHNWTPWKICPVEQTSCGFPWRQLQPLFRRHDVIFVLIDHSRSQLLSMLSRTLPVSLNLFRRRFIVSGWSVSAWKVPPKLSFILDKQLRREIGLYYLDPLMHGYLAAWSTEDWK